MTYRTDRNNNPTAFTTDIAKQAGLVEGQDYIPGDPFPPPSGLVTARLLGDPIKVTLQVLDRIGYYTESGQPRWSYIAIPNFIWMTLNDTQRRLVIKFHYQHEGGTELLPLLPKGDWK